MATFCGDHVKAAHDGQVIAAGRHFDELLGWVGDLGPYSSASIATTLEFSSRSWS